MEKNEFSPPSETNTASPNSPPPPLAMTPGGVRQCFSENLPETRDFGAEFFSMYRAIFPPKSSPLPSSLSLTPSTRSSSAGGGGCDYEDESATEHRLMQARLILEHQQLNDHYDLCQTHLLNLNKEIDILRRENAELRSVNNDLLKILSSPTAFQSFLLSSGAAYPNQALLDSFRRLDVGGVLAPDHGHGGEDVTDISPTSVMETNRFERPSAERVSLPKSISVRSSGYQKVISQSPGNSSREGPSRSSNRPRSVPNQTGSGTVSLSTALHTWTILPFFVFFLYLFFLDILSIIGFWIW